MVSSKNLESSIQYQVRVEVVTTGLWTGDTGPLTTFFTSSTQVGER